MASDIEVDIRTTGKAMIPPYRKGVEPIGPYDFVAVDEDGTRTRIQGTIPSIWIAQNTQRGRMTYSLFASGRAEEMNLKNFEPEAGILGHISVLAQNYNQIILNSNAFAGDRPIEWWQDWNMRHVIDIYALFDAYTFFATGSKPVKGEPTPSVFQHPTLGNPYEDPGCGIQRWWEILKEINADKPTMFPAELEVGVFLEKYMGGKSPVTV